MGTAFGRFGDVQVASYGTLFGVVVGPEVAANQWVEMEAKMCGCAYHVAAIALSNKCKAPACSAFVSGLSR